MIRRYDSIVKPDKCRSLVDDTMHGVGFVCCRERCIYIQVSTLIVIKQFCNFVTPYWPNFVQLTFHTTDTVARMRASHCGFPRFSPRIVPGGASCAPVHSVNDSFFIPPRGSLLP